MSYRSAVGRSSQRGGTVVLVRNYLAKSIVYVDMCNVDQIWINFCFAPRTLFGFCYIPPPDSEYYSNVAFASIQEKVKHSARIDSYVLVGDFNARFGGSVRQIPSLADIPNCVSYEYPDLPDPTCQPNDNAKTLRGIGIEDGLVVLNNMKVHQHHFKGGKTFKKGNEWVSELDLCVVSCNILKYMNDLRIIYQRELPSDHAPLALTMLIDTTSLKELECRAEWLGDHVVLHSQIPTNRMVRPVKIENVDLEMLKQRLEECEIPNASESVDVSANRITEALYECVRKAKCTQQNSRAGSGNETQSRWERMVNNKDDAEIWRAVNWAGELKPDENLVKPSDNKFKEYIESTQNLHDIPVSLEELNTRITIPVLDDPIRVLETECEARNMKANKACGPDGLTPGIFKMLPGPWLLVLTTIFNSIFSGGIYPAT